MSTPTKIKQMRTNRTKCWLLSCWRVVWVCLRVRSYFVAIFHLKFVRSLSSFTFTLYFCRICHKAVSLVLFLSLSLFSVYWFFLILNKYPVLVIWFSVCGQVPKNGTKSPRQYCVCAHTQTHTCWNRSRNESGRALDSLILRHTHFKFYNVQQPRKKKLIRFDSCIYFVSFCGFPCCSFFKCSSGFFFS